MTRQELEKLFAADKAPDHSHGKYVHRDCLFLSLEVEFSPSSPNQAKDHYERRDKITKVSKPYLDWTH